MLTTAEFIALARAQVGKPYRLGAEASVTDGSPDVFDCSELVEWLYGRNGTPIGDLAASQYDKTVAVTPGAERVGDLVFLRNNGDRWNGIGHVAVLTAKLVDGDFEVVEAKGRLYGVVRTTLSFWRTRYGFTGVRRFPPFALTAVVPASPLVSKPKALVVDGEFGPATITALQRKIGAKADGEFGPLSKRALQMWLGVHVDGVVGPVTVRALQARVGARVDGFWGPKTTAALQRYLNGEVGL